MNIEPEAFKEMQGSPLMFARHIWQLTPQAIKPEYAPQWRAGLATTHAAWIAFCASVRPFWFEPYTPSNLTWQQTLVLYGVEKALRGECSARISIVSGHGIGKSMLSAILVLWFLFAKYESQIAATAPTADQMYDVLWKEIKKWLDRMPPPVAALYIWESSHVRMKGSAEIWFARAKTSSKENTEALAGMHADWVFMLADEASGIDEPIFETMEGALTSGNTLVLLLGNGTRANGYFFDTHHRDALRWQTFRFSSLESPRVDEKYVQAIIDKYGTDSVQYAIRVEGKFPDEGVMDDRGYVPLFTPADLHIVPVDTHPTSQWSPTGRTIAALDPAGEGQDESVWAVRDNARAAIVAREAQSTAKGMAAHSLTVMEKYRIAPDDFIVDAFGAGHAVSQEIALATARYDIPYRVIPINSGEACALEADRIQYLNKRAEGYAKLLRWLRAGGELLYAERLEDELLSIRFKRTGNGRIQIMSKVDMKRLGYPSPNMADALSYLFLAKEYGVTREQELAVATQRRDFVTNKRSDAGLA